MAEILLTSRLSDGATVVTNYIWQMGIYDTRAFTPAGLPMDSPKPDEDVTHSDALRTHAHMIDDLCERMPEIERAKREVEWVTK